MPRRYVQFRIRFRQVLIPMQFEPIKRIIVQPPGLILSIIERKNFVHAFMMSHCTKSQDGCDNVAITVGVSNVSVLLCFFFVSCSNFLNSIDEIARTVVT